MSKIKIRNILKRKRLTGDLVGKYMVLSTISSFIENESDVLTYDEVQTLVDKLALKDDFNRYLEYVRLAHFIEVSQAKINYYESQIYSAYTIIHLRTLNVLQSEEAKHIYNSAPQNDALDMFYDQSFCEALTLENFPKDEFENIYKVLGASLHNYYAYMEMYKHIGHLLNDDRILQITPNEEIEILEALNNTIINDIDDFASKFPKDNSNVSFNDVFYPIDYKSYIPPKKYITIMKNQYKDITDINGNMFLSILVPEEYLDKKGANNGKQFK